MLHVDCAHESAILMPSLAGGMVNEIVRQPVDPEKQESFRPRCRLPQGARIG